MSVQRAEEELACPVPPSPHAELPVKSPPEAMGKMQNTLLQQQQQQQQQERRADVSIALLQLVTLT